MFRLAAVGLLVAGVALPGFAASPNPKDLAVPPAELARARELVRKLGSDEFATRDEAQSELAKMGRLAKPALAEAVNTDPDPEVRFRCRMLLPRAEAADLQARLEVFLADEKGKYEHDLPGWKAFREVAENVPTARTVFGEMLSDGANRTLLLAVGDPPGDFGPMVAARKTELYQMKFPRATVVNGVVVTASTARNLRDPSALDMVALLFAESQVESKYVPRSTAISSLLTTLASTGAFSNETEKGKVFRAVALKWIDTRVDAVDMYYGLTFATNLAADETALKLAFRLFATVGATSPYRGQAATVIAHLGKPEHLPQLAKLMTDESIIGSINRNENGVLTRIPILARDVALAVSLIVTKQNPEDYGFVEIGKGAVAAGRYTYTSLYLPEGTRAAAFEKWAAWRAKHQTDSKK